MKPAAKTILWFVIGVGLMLIGRWVGHSVQMAQWQWPSHARDARGLIEIVCLFTGMIAILVGVTRIFGDRVKARR